MLEDGLREGQVENKIKAWLDNSVNPVKYEDCEIEIDTEKTIYGNNGVKRDTDKDGFIGRVDFALMIQYRKFEHGVGEHGVGIECKGQSTTTDSDVMKHGIGQAVIYDQSTYDSYLAAPLSIIDSRGVAAAQQADIGLIGVTEDSIDIILSNGYFLPYLCELQ